MRVRLLKIMDATAGWVLCWTLGWLLHVFRKGGGTGLTPDLASLRRIVVIRPGGMGDMVLLLPMLRALRRHCPQAAVDLVCERRNRDILDLAGLGGGVARYDGNPLRLLWRLRRTSCDVVIDTEQFHNLSAVMALVTGASVRIGFKINPARNAIYTHLVNYDLEGYEAGEFMRLLEPLGIREPAVVEGTLKAPAADAMPPGLAPAWDALARGRRLVVIQAGSASRYKAWPAERFIALIRRLASDPDRFFVIIGGKPDRRFAAAIVRRVGLGGRVMAVAGALTVERTVVLLGRASLYIGLDSGMGHVAVALGLPTVVLFGPSDHRKWGVDGGRHAVVRRPLACAPCFIFGYHKFCRTFACMQGVRVDDVLDAIGAVERAVGGFSLS
jgi:ADP-heptose:LPS heptosyltransferase